MDSYELYDFLPNGVIVFKNTRVEYINKHIIDIFNLGDFTLHNSIDIIMKTISIESEEELFSFFCDNSYFRHKSKVIQISHSRVDDRDIFLFVLIEKSLLKETFLSDNKRVEIDEKITAHFKLKHIKKVGILTFYKGLPLKNIGTIVRINSDSIEVKVDQKHNISLLNKKDIIIIANKNESFPVIYGSVEKSNANIFTIKNFTLTKNDKHLRKSVRIKPEDDIYIKLEDRVFQVYDISEKGVSLYVDNSENHNLLKMKKSFDIIFFDQVAHANVEYLKTIYADNGEIIKIIFNMYNVSKNEIIIKDYIMRRQNEVIKEIHNYMEKLNL